MTLYEWLLALYPRRVRERFGDGMREAFAADYARHRAHGRWRALRFLLVTISDTVVSAAGERLPRPATLRSFLATDVRDAVRSLRATPAITAVAVLSLALGIGANTALFSILYSLVMKPLPVAEPHRLVLLDGNDWTNPIWEQIRDRDDHLFDGAFAWARERFNLAPSGRVDPVYGGYVSGGMFHVLGIDTTMGRSLTEGDDVRGGGPQGHVVVISHRFWHQRFGGTPDALGRAITVNGVPFTIVGVTPAGFLGPEVGHAMDLFLPLAAEAAIRGAESALNGRSSWWLQVMLRLKRGQSIEDAAGALNAIRPAIREATIPEDIPADRRAGYLQDAFTLAPAATGVSRVRGRFAQPLTMLLIVVAAVLMIACANIVNLMLARAAARRHEMTVRLALGASRLRLGAQLLVESLLLAAAGGIAGLALARIGAGILVNQLGTGPGAVTLDLSLDWRVIGFTTAIALTATLLFGLAPAFGVRVLRPGEVLKDQSRTAAGERRFGLRSAVVILQVALSFVLVAGAGLFIRTFVTLASRPLGFNPERLLIVTVDARSRQLAATEQVAFFERVADAAARAPGVARASLSFLVPLSGRGWNSRIEIRRPGETGRQQVAWLNAVAPGWFETYGMRLLAGRDFAPTDTAGGERVVVVNEAFVRRFMDGEDPLGQRLKSSAAGSVPDSVIVGVVNDGVYRHARAGVVPTMYVPMTQGAPYGAAFSVTARVAGEPRETERAIAAAVTAVDPTLMVSFLDYSDQIRATLVQERLVAILSGFFGGLAVLLAALGVYGVTSYSVNRRRSELAVRIALGASTRGVVVMVLRRVSVLLVAGTAIGLMVTLWATRFVGALLYRVEGHDPVTLTAAVIVLAVIALIAGWLPARRVSRLDPIAALRQGG